MKYDDLSEKSKISVTSQATRAESRCACFFPLFAALFVDVSTVSCPNTDLFEL